MPVLVSSIVDVIQIKSWTNFTHFLFYDPSSVGIFSFLNPCIYLSSKFLRSDRPRRRRKCVFPHNQDRESLLILSLLAEEDIMSLISFSYSPLQKVL